MLPEHVLQREEQKRQNKKESQGSLKHKFLLLRFLIPLALVAYMMYLIFLPQPIPRTLSINERYASKFETKLLRLQEYYNNKQPYRIAITEDELNSFLKLNMLSETPDLFNLFLDEGITIFMSRTMFGKTVTLKIYSGLQIKNGILAPEILHVRLGKLPIPSFLVRYLIDKLFIRKFKDSLTAPSFMTGFEFSENILYILYDPYYHEEQQTQKKQGSDKQVDNLLVKANALYKEQRFDEALKIYRTIISDYPTDPRIAELQKWCDDLSARTGKNQ